MAHPEKRGCVVALDNINVVTNNNNIEEYVKYQAKHSATQDLENLNLNITASPPPINEIVHNNLTLLTDQGEHCQQTALMNTTDRTRAFVNNTHETSVS